MDVEFEGNYAPQVYLENHENAKGSQSEGVHIIITFSESELSVNEFWCMLFSGFNATRGPGSTRLI